MWYEDYLKKHPYLPRQAAIGAVSVLTFAVVIGEHKIEVERRFYRDDLPAHVYHYESPLPMTYCLTSGSGTIASSISLNQGYKVF